MNEPRDPNLKPILHVVRRDETRFWNADVVEKAGRLFGVYLIDKSSETYCCELTPSRWLEYIGPTWSGGPELDDEARDALFEDILQACADSEGIYMHLRAADALAVVADHSPTDDEWKAALDEHDGDADKACEALIADVIEYEQTNGGVY